MGKYIYFSRDKLLLLFNEYSKFRDIQVEIKSKNNYAYRNYDMLWDE